MKRWSIPLLLLLQLTLQACTTLVKLPDAAVDSAPETALNSYARVLQKYVNDRGEVDFSALQQDHTDLDRYVVYIARTPASAFPTSNERLAHYINSYNALSMYNILASGIPETHAGFAKFRFFYLREFVIGGRTLSLYAYENDVIRKLGEPRIHFALNCSARGCPLLPRSPFTGRQLDAELERATRQFFAETRNLRLDPSHKTVYLSEILSFYTEDFVPAQAPNLIDYVNRYAPEPIPEDYRVEFIDYDWTVANSRRPPAE